MEGKKGRLYIIGSSHIAKQSVREVKKYIEEEKPDIIAVELDAQRATALLQGGKRKVPFSALFNIGFGGFLFSVVGSWVQKKLGKIVGMDPGSEMKMALKLAKKHKIQVVLIDQDVRITLRRFSRNFGWREVKQIIKDIFSSRKKKISFDLSSVPEDEVIDMMVEEVRQNYPRIHKVLINERNKIMVKNLKQIMTQSPEKNILAVVGAGHKKDMVAMLAKKPLKREELFGRIHPSSLSKE